MGCSWKEPTAGRLVTIIFILIFFQLNNATLLVAMFIRLVQDFGLESEVRRQFSLIAPIVHLK